MVCGLHSPAQYSTNLRWLQGFTQDVIRPRECDRVFDIDCGPGALLRYLPAGTSYVGFDRNEGYVECARRTHGNRGEFICDDLANFASYRLAPADIVVAIGVIHHLDDTLVVNMLRTVAAALKPGGRLVTADPCFHPEQSAIERFVVSHDRGNHVRPYGRYIELARATYIEPNAMFQRGLLPFPHSICIMEAAPKLL